MATNKGREGRSKLIAQKPALKANRPPADVADSKATLGLAGVAKKKATEVAAETAAVRPKVEPEVKVNHGRCYCPCHSGVNVDVHVAVNCCCGEKGQGHHEPKRPDATETVGGKTVPPPEGASGNPWDIMQIIQQVCQKRPSRPRKDSFLPYLVVRANAGDRGARPLATGTVFWESPDIFVMPNQPAAGAPQVPANLGGMAQAGVPNTLFAHVWNLGRAPAFDVRVEFYWFNPTLGIEESDANFIGHTYVSLGARGSLKSHLVVQCPVDWIPTFVNGGHECIVVRAFSMISDPLGPNDFHAAQNRHVAQRNLAVLQGQQAQSDAVNLQVAPGHSTHEATIATVTVDPAEVPWMQLIAMKRDSQWAKPKVTPLVGITPPTAVLDGGTAGLKLGGLSAEALASLLYQRHSFKRSTDPIQISLVTRAPRLSPGEAHVVRVQQYHEDTLVGGYTTILLP